MTKKQTDASSILGAARRAADVQRPKVEEASPTEVTSGRVSEKRVNVGLFADTHLRLKLLSVKRRMTVQDLTEQLVREYLDSHDV